jgi:hypothetical protein
MFETDEDVEEFEAPDDDLDDDDLDEDELESGDDDEDQDEGEDEGEEGLEADDEAGSSSASLDELLAQRAAAHRDAGEPDDDDDLMSLASERDDDVRGASPPRVVPIKQRQEFVCNRCRLVKAKSQLADPQRGLCRDCV